MSSILYTTRGGRFILKFLTKPFLSRAIGGLLNRRPSRFLVRPFIRRYQLDLTDYPDRPYQSFNDFFTRTIIPERRPIDYDEQALISPCDGLMSAYLIDENASFMIKGSRYTTAELLQNEELARRYMGGYLVVLRLTVAHYHRYCYLDDGSKEENVRIPGILHTVRPIAHMYYKVFKTNVREYTLLHTKHHGDIIQMEVGATMVGRIANDHPSSHIFSRGEEKGHFEFGGSTIILLLEKNQVELRHLSEEELPVRLGERIGYTKTKVSD